MGFFLRSFALLFRLNFYDTLDDIFDSYYFFVGDFDDDEYSDDLLFSISSLFFYDNDVNDDRINSFEEENDFSFDLFFIYFLSWGKFFFFLILTFDEIFRVSIALYICYLILLEVNTVNSSLVEDFYFFKLRFAISK